jgi:puromycin-sensitive aminopeptidase
VGVSLSFVSHLQSPYRLPRTVLPSKYAVSLSPDLDKASFTGSVTISADATQVANEIVLNAIELDIHAVEVNGSPVPFSLNEELERLIIDAAVSPGPITLHISFTGTLNDKLRGFYRSTFTDENDAIRTIATTQMQSTDCRRAFPCFDEPDFKATFAIDITCDADLLAVSNGREIRRETQPNGQVRIWFSETMLMSTYLVAFVVGPLEATEPVMVGSLPLRVIHVPGKSHLTEFGLRVGAFCIEWFENYYGIPYPSDKCDLLALPDFAAGAMENLGCITFREVLLLVDPATSTQIEQELVAAVVAHELAHMWFGDLVTMRWWNGIWLNEAFATFMEVAATDAFAPQWTMWTSFGLDRSAAFEVDSLHSTRTVEFPVESPADADGMFDVLTYQKGGALLRMLEQYLGPDRFRAGVNHYLKKHSYGNTETGDLWDAIEHVVSTDGGENVPVRALMDSWIWQAGYPLVSARVDGAALVLSQRQFTFDNTPNATLWVIPVHVRVGNEATKVLLNTDELRLPLANSSATVVVNAGGPGFYRVEYSTDLLSRITGTTLATLTTLERYNLVDDAWNAVVAGALTTENFIEFARGFENENDLAVWQVLTKALAGLGRLIPRDNMAPFNTFVSSLVTPAYTRLGESPAPNEDDLVSKLRGLLLSTLAIHGNSVAAQQRCRNILMNHAESDPELVAASTTVVAATGNNNDYEWFVDKFTNAPTPQEKVRMLYALAEFDDVELMKRTCRLAFSGDVKSQDAPFLLARCIANKNHGDIAWAAVQENWTYANDTFPGNTIVRMVSTITTLNTEALETQVNAFFSEHPIPQATKTLEQALERQKVNVALRSREGATILTALQK